MGSDLSHRRRASRISSGMAVQGLWLAALMVLIGCDQRGFSGLEAEWERRKAQQFYVVAASPEAAVISALGRELAIRPADGFCLSDDSIETSAKSAVALIGDCALEADVDRAKRSARGALQLPRGLPGIITVSISGDPNRGESRFDFDAIEAFLQSAQGRALIGRTPDGSNVTIHESRREGDAVFVLVEDKNTGPIPILSDRFWRAFVTLKDRLAVITINGFRDKPLGVETMLGHLSDQVVAMQRANLETLEDTKRFIAGSRTIDAERVASAEQGGVGSRAPDETSLRDLLPTSILVSTTGTSEAKDPSDGSDAVAEADALQGQGGDASITIEPSTTLPQPSVTIPRAKPKATVPVLQTRTATLRNPASNAAGEATAPTNAPMAPKRRKRS